MRGSTAGRKRARGYKWKAGFLAVAVIGAVAAIVFWPPPSRADEIVVLL